jgi:hypothetical protein
LAKYLGRYRRHYITPVETAAGAPLSSHYVDQLVQGYVTQIGVFERLIVLIKTKVANSIVCQFRQLLKNLFELQSKMEGVSSAAQEIEHKLDSDGNGIRKEIKNGCRDADKWCRAGHMALSFIQRTLRKRERA